MKGGVRGEPCAALNEEAVLAQIVQIRALEQRDLSALLSMVVDLTKHHHDEPRLTPESVARDFFGPVAWYHGLVAVRGPKVVGYAATLPLGRLGYGTRGLELHHLFVDPTARHQGVGRQLVRAVETLARELDCTYVMIGTHPDNHAAQGYYQHLGYAHHASLAKRFSKRLDSAP